MGSRKTARSRTRREGGVRRDVAGAAAGAVEHAEAPALEDTVDDGVGLVELGLREADVG